MILSDFGHSFPYEMKAKCMGLKALDVAELIVTKYTLPITPNDYYQRATALQCQLFTTCEKMPGAESLVPFLKANRIPCAVATSSMKKTFELKANSHQNFFSLFDSIVVGDDPKVKKGKPHPDIFIEAAHRFILAN